jgi:hypothetical protein
LLGEALKAMPNDLRVGVVASGGLTHFVVDEDLDRGVLAAFAAGEDRPLREIHPHAFRSGNSEILNWIVVAGAVQGHRVAASEYIPVYRTSAGTGIGLGFVTWLPAS